MARRSSGGLSITQVITLTFGFLFASVLIFICGWWVGYDMAEQRLANDPQIIRLPAPPPPTPLPTSPAAVKPTAVASPAATAAAASPATAASPLPTATRPATAAPTTAVPSPTRPSTATRTHTRTRVPATDTPVVPPTATAEIPTPAPVTPIPVTPEEAPKTEGGEAEGAAKIWTVQAFSTTDTVQAIVQQRRLRDRGYEVFIVTSQIQGTPWYQVRVGRYKDREAANAVADRLRIEEGLEGAFVASQ